MKEGQAKQVLNLWEFPVQPIIYHGRVQILEKFGIKLAKYKVMIINYLKYYMAQIGWLT